MMDQFDRLYEQLEELIPGLRDLQRGDYRKSEARARVQGAHWKGGVIPPPPELKKPETPRQVARAPARC